MNKLEGGLIIIIFFLNVIISVMGCYMYQQKMNEELMFSRLNQMIVMQNEEIAKLEYKQSLMQKDLARTGLYDKK